MDEAEDTNREAVLVYVNGAREALQSAQYNLDGSFYAATALLLTLDITRSKHSGVLAAFREHFVRPGKFAVQDSRAYGEAFELRNVTDYEMLGQADPDQAQVIVDKANRFVDRCQAYLAIERYL